MSGFKMLTDSRNIMLLSLSAVSEMETVSRPRCRTGIEEKLEYSISLSYGTTQSLTLKTEVR